MSGGISIVRKKLEITEPSGFRPDGDYVRV